MTVKFNINLLKTKHNLLYIRKQSVQRCKHFPRRLQKPVSLCCIKQLLLFVLRSAQNPQRKASNM